MTEADADDAPDPTPDVEVDGMEFGEFIEEFPIGKGYDSVTVDDDTIEQGDIIVYYETSVPASVKQRGVSRRATFGYVDAIIAPQFESDNTVIATTAAHRQIRAPMVWEQFIEDRDNGPRPFWLRAGDVYTFSRDDVEADDVELTIDADPEHDLVKYVEPFHENFDQHLTLRWGDDIDGVPGQSFHHEGE